MRLVVVPLALVLAFGACRRDDRKPVDRQAVQAACSGTAALREAIAKRDMAGITAGAKQVAADASHSGEPAVEDGGDDVLREGVALVKPAESADFYKAHLAAMEDGLTAIDDHCK